MHSDISNIDEKAHGVGKKISYWLIEIIGNVSSKMTFWDMDLSWLHAVLSELLAHCVKLFTREGYPVITFLLMFRCLTSYNVLFCSNSVAVRSMIAQNYSLTQLKLISVLPVCFFFFRLFLAPHSLGAGIVCSICMLLKYLGFFSDLKMQKKQWRRFAAKAVQIFK